MLLRIIHWSRFHLNQLRLYFDSLVRIVGNTHRSLFDIRIGLHQGDVIISNDDVLGDDVNIASRIEPISAVGGIAVSEKVVMDLMSSPEYTFKYLGVPELKGVKQNVKVFSLSSHSMPLPKAGFLLKKESTKAKNSSTIISIIGTIILVIIL